MEKLFRYFEEHGIRTENPCHGIYYVLDRVLFPTQIIVTKELDSKHHTWLRSLTDKIEEKDMRRLLIDTSRLKGKQEKEFADSVLEVCFRANRQIIEKLKGDDTMSEALLEIMEPLIEPIIAERERTIEIRVKKETKEEMAKAKEEAAKAKEEAAKAKEEGIKNTILLLSKLGHNNDVIRTAIMEQYLLSDEEVNKYL